MPSIWSLDLEQMQEEFNKVKSAVLLRLACDEHITEELRLKLDKEYVAVIAKKSMWSKLFSKNTDSYQLHIFKNDNLFVGEEESEDEKV